MSAVSAIRRGRSSVRGNRPRGADRPRLRPGRALLWAGGLTLAVVLVGALSLGLLMGFRWLTVSPFFALTRVEVAGNVRLTREEILTLAGVEPGENVLELRISDVEGRVAASPWAARVAVRRVLPDGLSIVVTERSPAYFVRTGKGLCYAEADGSVITAVDADRFTGCPLLMVDQSAGDGVDGLAARLAALDGAGLPVRWAQAAWLRLLPDGMELYFEDRGLRVSVADEDFDGNMARLSQVWEDLARRGEDARTKEVRVLGGRVWVRT
ncbi:cell division protein FtsQ/DivIB [Desulfocurvus sp. DL9XJH121]